MGLSREHGSLEGLAFGSTQVVASSGRADLLEVRDSVKNSDR